MGGKPKPIAPNACPIRERTGDGVSVGRCWHYLVHFRVDSISSWVCQSHGDVTKQVEEFKRTGRLQEETDPITPSSYWVVGHESTTENK